MWMAMTVLFLSSQRRFSTVTTKLFRPNFFCFLRLFFLEEFTWREIACSFWCSISGTNHLNWIFLYWLNWQKKWQHLRNINTVFVLLLVSITPTYCIYLKSIPSVSFTVSFYFIENKKNRKITIFSLAALSSLHVSRYISGCLFTCEVNSVMWYFYLSSDLTLW